MYSNYNIGAQRADHTAAAADASQSSSSADGLRRRSFQISPASSRTPNSCSQYHPNSAPPLHERQYFMQHSHPHTTASHQPAHHRSFFANQSPGYSQHGSFQHSVGETISSGPESRQYSDQQMPSSAGSGNTDRLRLQPFNAGLVPPGEYLSHQEQIIARVGQVRSQTESSSNERYLSNATSIQQGVGHFRFETYFDKHADNFTVEHSQRSNFPGFFASDAYLAHLSNAVGADARGLPTRLPTVISISLIVNGDTIETMNAIRTTYDGGPETPLRIDPRNNEFEHEDMQTILDSTVIGKSTARLVSEYNAAKGTAYNIAAVTITLPDRMDFEMGHA